MRSALALLTVLAIASPALALDPPALQLRIAAEPIAALAEHPAACAPEDIPDAPARAIRLRDGTVQLYASDQINRVNRGPDLLHVQHDCTVVLRGAGSDDPAAYDDHAWIATPWIDDDDTIWAIIHDEFHGHTCKSLCPTGRYMDCWFNALTLASSTDAGRSFHRAPAAPPGSALVAALPYRYDELGLGHHGYFNPSNIARLDGDLYMFAFATHANAQREGNCLLRSSRIGRADAWRAWDGAAFSIAFANPYSGPVQPEQHVCMPVANNSLRWPITALVQHASTGLFVALMQDTTRHGGIYYATSPDLLGWSSPERLLPIGGLPEWACGDTEPVAYPSLLDPSSQDRNFQTVGSTAELFVTRFEHEACRLGRTRTLIRWHVEVSPLRAKQP